MDASRTSRAPSTIGSDDESLQKEQRPTLSELPPVDVEDRPAETRSTKPCCGRCSPQWKKFIELQVQLETMLEEFVQLAQQLEQQRLSEKNLREQLSATLQTMEVHTNERDFLTAKAKEQEQLNQLLRCGLQDTDTELTMVQVKTLSLLEHISQNKDLHRNIHDYEAKLKDAVATGQGLAKIKVMVTVPDHQPQPIVHHGFLRLRGLILVWNYFCVCLFVCFWYWITTPGRMATRKNTPWPQQDLLD